MTTQNITAAFSNFAEDSQWIVDLAADGIRMIAVTVLSAAVIVAAVDAYGAPQFWHDLLRGAGL